MDEENHDNIGVATKEQLEAATAGHLKKKGESQDFSEAEDTREALARLNEYSYEGMRRPAFLFPTQEEEARGTAEGGGGACGCRARSCACCDGGGECSACRAGSRGIQEKGGRGPKANEGDRGADVR